MELNTHAYTPESGGAAFVLNHAAAAAFPFPVATNAGRFSSARNSRFSPISRLNTSAFDHDAVSESQAP